MKMGRNEIISASRTVMKMIRRIILVSVLIVIVSGNIGAAPLSFRPVTKILPDGTSIRLFISGDEFFNYLHDENKFPVGIGSDGYYYYMLQEGDNFTITAYRAGVTDPFTIPGIKKVIIPGYVIGKREAFQAQMKEISEKAGLSSNAKAGGQYNNLVIYIKFKNEGNFNIRRTTFDEEFNSENNFSMRNYFREVSYNKLDIVSYHFPGGVTQEIIYTDSNLRNYYQAYSFSTNPSGYRTDTEKTQREHDLLANAVNTLSSAYSLPAGIDFDQNDDKIMDNVIFIIKGDPDGWDDLLWPHRWVLYTRTVKIGGLQVYGYNFQFENVDVTTLSHEMFHSLGAPDLYHYDNDEDPVGPWDIMSYGQGHPGAWMKYRYGGWISSIPEIKASGTYVLKPLVQVKSNCYKIRSPYRDDQFFIVEFRKREGMYESFLPSSGMIIQRINDSYTGNSTGPPDEIYIFRENGSLTSQGNINSAALSDLFGRESFSDKSNPKAFFQDGSVTGVDVSKITFFGDSITFTVNIDTPVDLVLEPVEDSGISASWKSLSTNNFLVAVSTTDETITPSSTREYAPGDTIGKNGFVVQFSNSRTTLQKGLESDEMYYFTVWTIRTKGPFIYSDPVKSNARTGIYTIEKLPHTEDFDNIGSDLPRGWKASSGEEGWKIDPFSTVSAPNAILLTNTTGGTENWLYTPGFRLNGNTKYQITFQYRNASAGAKGTLSLQGGRNRHDGGLDQFDLFTASDFNFRNFSTSKSVFRPSATSIYYFGFKTGNTAGRILIDGFRIEAVPAETREHDKPEEFYPNPTTGRIFVPATGETKITVFRSDGTQIYETSIESACEVDLSSLNAGTYIVRFTEKERSVSGKLIIIHE
jgi:M6 family metalloprotease-like protein